MMIVTKNIKKTFGRFEAVRDVSFEIAKGEIVGFLGQNGAGKTTLMRILTSYLKATSGSVMIDGKDVTRNALALRRKIGYLPETPPLYPDMTIKNYLRFAAQLKDIVPNQQQFQVDRVLEECDLIDAQNKIIGTLSKGYKQRVGIGQTIINEPDLLILDEPTSGLDPVQILQVRKLIRNLEYRRTVIISTHILAEVEQLAKHVIIIKSGLILADALIEDLIKEGSDKICVHLYGDRLALEEVIKNANGLRQLEFITRENTHFITLEIRNPLKHYNKLIEKLIAAGGQILEIKPHRANLEDVFLKLNANVQ